MRLRLVAAAIAVALPTMGLVATTAPSAGAATSPVLFGLTDKWKDQISADNSQLHLTAGVVDLFQQWVATSTKRTTVKNWMSWVRGASGAPGGAPMLTLQPPTSASLSSINAGHYDAQLRAWAHTIASWGHPMFVRLFPEMNQKSHSYSPGYGSNTAAQFRTAWRHVVTLMRNAGAHNIAFIWCPYRVYSTSTPLKSVWPGASYVNWVGFDAYNYDDSHHAFAWPYALFSPTVKAIRSIAPYKPLVIAEVGTRPESQKPTWISRSVTAAQSVGAKAMLWFDESAEYNWRLDSAPSPSVINAARTALHSSAITYAGKWSIARIDQLVSTGK